MTTNLQPKMSNYVEKKINHMIRLGLLTESKNFSGYGKNNGACPIWLHEAQQDEEKRINAYHLRRKQHK